MQKSILEYIKSEISKACEGLGFPPSLGGGQGEVGIVFNVSFTDESNKSFGDVSSNVAMTLAKDLNKSPRDVALQIIENLKRRDEERGKENNSFRKFKDLNIAGPGFINFSLTDEYLESVCAHTASEVLENIKEKDLQEVKGKTILVEYTDPNPFKVFHIGHLMTNIIGESLSRLYEVAGAKVKRLNYQGDVGRHIAINIFAILKEENKKKFFELSSGTQDVNVNHDKSQEKKENIEKIIKEVAIGNLGDIFRKESFFVAELTSELEEIVGDKNIFMSPFIWAKIQGKLVGNHGHRLIDADFLRKIEEKLNKAFEILKDNRIKNNEKDKYIFVGEDPIHQIVMQLEKGISGETVINTIFDSSSREIKRLETLGLPVLLSRSGGSPDAKASHPHMSPSVLSDVSERRISGSQNDTSIISASRDLSNEKSLNVKAKVTWLGERYAEGYADFARAEEDESKSVESKKVLQSVVDINKHIYARDDSDINEIYDIGKSWSMDYFETLYKMLGTKFDKYIMESEAAPVGLEIVKDNFNENGGGVFEYGDEGAIIFDGEKYGLHKRVFVNKNGLPTYEAKDLGNMEIKKEAFPDFEKSVVITAVEQSDYFKVLYKAIEALSNKEKENLESQKQDSQSGLRQKSKLLHYGHGMMRFADGKMSSRKGNIIAGDTLIEEVKNSLKEKFVNSKIDSEEEKEFVLEKVAVAAVKYVVLKQSIGKDVIFDMEKVISVEGDSGPYLQYTYARLNSVAKENSTTEKSFQIKVTDSNRSIILKLNSFEDILSEVVKDLAPQKVSSYLIDLTREANSWYAKNKIAGNVENEVLAHKVKEALKTGLDLLGIYAPERM